MLHTITHAIGMFELAAIFSFRNLPGLKWRTCFSGTGTDSPDFGLRLIPAFRVRREKVPKPRTSQRPPFSKVETINSNNDRVAWSMSFSGMSLRWVDRLWMSSDLFMAITLWLDFGEAPYRIFVCECTQSLFRIKSVGVMTSLLKYFPPHFFARISLRDFFSLYFFLLTV